MQVCELIKLLEQCDPESEVELLGTPDDNYDDMEWVYSLDGENFGEIFDTKDEAVRSAIEEIELNCKGTNSFWLASPEYYSPKIYVESIIEELQEDAYEFADEHSVDWLEGIPKENKMQLEDDLNKVLTAWIVKNKFMPSFYRTDGQTLMYIDSRLGGT